jgi:hypothetical protein
VVPLGPAAPALEKDCSEPLLAMPTMGLLRGLPPWEPKNSASPKAKIPPSAATSQ